MNVIEQWSEEQLTRVPAGPSADELRRRAHARRARRVGGSLIAVAMIVAVLGVAARVRSPAPRHVEVLLPAPTTTLPDAINVPGFSNGATRPKDKRNSAVYNRINRYVSQRVRTDTADPRGVPVDSAEVVATIRGAKLPQISDNLDGAGQRRYIVQVTGDFVCRDCHGQVVATHWPVMESLFDAVGNVVGTTFVGEPEDLSRFGTVYRMPIGFTT